MCLRVINYIYIFQQLFKKQMFTHLPDCSFNFLLCFYIKRVCVKQCLRFSQKITMIIFIKKTRCKITWNTATKSFKDLINKLPSLPLFVDYTQISDDDEPLRLLATYSNRFREQLVPAQDHSVIQIKGQNSVTPQQKFTCDQTKHY